MLMLRDQKLQPRVDVIVRHEKTPFNCAQAVVVGDADAAGFPNVSLPNLPAEIRDKLQIIAESDDMPGILFMVRPAGDSPTAEAFQKALLGFVASEAGRTYLKEFNHDGLSKPDMKALRALDRFVPEIRRLMQRP
jgi:phosphonate transport system substrate-binding protein